MDGWTALVDLASTALFAGRGEVDEVVRPSSVFSGLVQSSWHKWMAQGWTLKPSTFWTSSTVFDQRFLGFWG
jgi:hypothetical protein